MLKKYFSVLGPALRLLDSIIVVACWLLAYYLRQNYPLPMMSTELPPLNLYASYTIVIVLLWQAVFSVSNLYSSKRLTRRTVEAYKVLRAHSISILIFISLTYLVAAYKLSRGVFVYFYFMAAVLLVYSRIILRNTLRKMRIQGFNIQKVLIVGTGDPALQTFHKLKHHPELGLKILGFIETNANSSGRAVDSAEILGALESLPQLVLKLHPDKIVVALSRIESTKIEEVLAAVKNEVIDVVLVPDIYEYVALGCEVEDFDGIPMVSLNESPIVGMNFFLKRISDVFFASAALILCSPIMLILVVLIKLTSRGSVFFYQERMSLNGRRFQMLKFRSMIVEHKGDVELLTKKNDPRVTWVGQWMRKTSLDELPQFINVLKGDMSLVGPRPERTWVVEKVRDQIPKYMLKHKVKAGITGWAQVNGWRGDTSLEKRIEYDLYYIKNWSFLFDMKIIFLTVFKGLVNRNAY